MMNNPCADFGPRPHDRAQPKATNQPGRSMQLEPTQRRGRRGVTDGSRAARKAGRARRRVAWRTGMVAATESHLDGVALGKGAATTSMMVFSCHRRLAGG
jgi:hypothetical protein